MLESPIDQTLKEISGFISLPEIYLKFRQLMDDPNSRIEEFTEVISYDPGLAARILKIVNSVFFGFPGQIESINRAVILLGIGQLHDMILGTSAVKLLDISNDLVPLKTFWRCSLFTAILARLLAVDLKIIKGERLFIIGLLHEIGHLVIYAKYPGEAKLVIEQYQTGLQPIHEVESKLFGFHYGELGAGLMAHWQLPIHFQQITQFQPDPLAAKEMVIETWALHVAHGLAHKLFIAPGLSLHNLVLPEVMSKLNLDDSQIEELQEKALKAVSDIEKFFLQ